MVFLDPVLNPVLQPLLNMSPLLTVVVLALFISLVITLSYKFLTNQSQMKELKEKQKGCQKKMKELRSDSGEMMKMQKEAMSANMEYMKHSLKPTLITMLPIILIFGWMTAHLSFEPIYPGEPYSITAEFTDGVTGQAELVVDEGTELLSETKQDINSAVTWNLKSEEGAHLLTVKHGDNEQQKKVLITTELEYEQAISVYPHSSIEKVTVNYNKLKPLGPTFTVPLFNWQPGWLGLYLILSIVFSLALRKWLNIY